MSNYNFAETLRKARSDSGLSQAKVSDLLYLSRSTYNHFETGLRTPSIETLIRISSIYRINPMELIIPLIPSEIKEEKPDYMNFILKSNNQKTYTNQLILDKINSLNKEEQENILTLIDTILNAHNNKTTMH